MVMNLMQKNVLFLGRCRFSLRKLVAIAATDLVMSLVICMDWPGAIQGAASLLVPYWLDTLWTDLFYGYTILFCLFTGMLYVALMRFSMPLGRVQCRWLSVMTFVSVFSGVGPLVAINKYHFFRIGVPGFVAPLILLLLLFFIDWYCQRCRAERSRILGITLVLFGFNVAITLAIRFVMYLIQL